MSARAGNLTSCPCLLSEQPTNVVVLPLSRIHDRNAQPESMSNTRATHSIHSTKKPLVGVLALQGDFREHARMLKEVGAQTREVRLPADLEGLDGLIIPGGESTTIGKLMVAYELQAPLRRLIAAGTPVWGTCAG